MIIKEGYTVITMTKFIGIRTAAKNPKALIGMSLENPVAKNANAVVLEVTSIAFAALLQV